jgi:hypothetical protein
MESKRSRFPLWSNLSPTMKGIASFGLCVFSLVLLALIVRVCCPGAPGPEAIAITSVDQPDDAAFMAMPIAIGMVLIIDATGHDLPGAWMRCEGQTLRREDYPELAAALGAATDASAPSQVRLPDYRGLSVAKVPESGLLRRFSSGRTYGNLNLKSAAPIPIPGATMSELSFIIRVK